MPAPDQQLLVTPIQTRIQISLEPAQNAMHSLLLLAKLDKHAGLSDWVTDTVQAMSDDDLQRHRLVMIGFFYAVQPRRSWPSFPAYLDHLASLEPLALRAKLMHSYQNLPCLPYADQAEREQVDLEVVLASVDSFLDFLGQRFTPDHIDRDLESQAYAYILQPEAMQDLIVDHLRLMWSAYLEDEWRRVEPMLQTAVSAFSQEDYSALDNQGVVEYITGQTAIDSHLLERIDLAEQLLFVPSAHIGPYLGSFNYGNATLGIIFGARLPTGSHYFAPDLSRAELLVRLDAIADDTRLRILQLIAEEGEQRSQEIIQRLDLSQSAASRHLKQLSATGYLLERRCEGGKCYALNRERLADTLRAVAGYLDVPLG